MLTECIVAQLDIYSVELMALTTIDSDCARQRGQKDKDVHMGKKGGKLFLWMI